MLKALKSYLDVLKTRSGRETALGLKPNKLLQALKLKALEEFKQKHPEYHLEYEGASTVKDYDGYIQYYDFQKQKICLLVEGKSNLRTTYLSVPRNTLGRYRFSDYQELNCKEEIPEIRDLLGADELSHAALEDLIKYGMNIVLANSYIHNLFSSVSDSDAIKRKKHLKDALQNMIKNKVLAFGSYEELANSSINTQLTAIAVFLKLIEVSEPESIWELKEADDEVFSNLKNNPNYDPIIKTFVGKLSSTKTAQHLYYSRRFNSKSHSYLDIPTKPLDMINW